MPFQPGPGGNNSKNCLASPLPAFRHLSPPESGAGLFPGFERLQNHWDQIAFFMGLVPKKSFVILGPGPVNWDRSQSPGNMFKCRNLPKACFQDLCWSCPKNKNVFDVPTSPQHVPNRHRLYPTINFLRVKLRTKT